jgi:hypothetical protein
MFFTFHYIGMLHVSTWPNKNYGNLMLATQNNAKCQNILQLAALELISKVTKHWFY